MAISIRLRHLFEGLGLDAWKERIFPQPPNPVDVGDIYDVFPFFNELDLLRIRFETLYDVVDKFVLMEAPWTHQGDAKPLYFEENRHLFSDYDDKIIHVVMEAHPFERLKQDPWRLEELQRNAIYKTLQTCCGENDLILVSDVDEIPSDVSVKKMLELVAQDSKSFCVCTMPLYRYYLNLTHALSDHSKGYWHGTCGILFGQIGEQSLSALRHSRMMHKKVRKYKKYEISNGGWHLTSLGGYEQFVKKHEAFAHRNHNTRAYKSRANFNAHIKRHTWIPIEKALHGLPNCIQDKFLTEFEGKGLFLSREHYRTAIAGSDLANDKTRT